MANTRNLQIAGTTDIETVTYNGNEVAKVIYNGVTVWENAPVYGYITYIDSEGRGQSYTVTSAEDMGILGNNTPFVTQDRTLELSDITLNSAQVTSFEFTQLGANTKVKNFLAGCFNLTTVTGTEMMKYVGGGFCGSCTSLDCPLVYPGSFAQSGTTERDGIAFLDGCTAFNSPITFASTATYIGTQFLQGCTSFNQPLTLPTNLTNIDSFFLSHCTSFNQPLVIPDQVDELALSFMENCTSFDSVLTLPTALTHISADFLQLCSSYKQPLTIPSSVTRIQSSFLFGAKSFTGPLTIESTATPPTDSYTLAANSSTDPIYTTGVTLRGAQASAWKAALPNSTKLPYRKLVLGN